LVRGNCSRDPGAGGGGREPRREQPTSLHCGAKCEQGLRGRTMLRRLCRAGMCQCETYQAGCLFPAGAMSGRLPSWAARAAEAALRRRLQGWYLSILEMAGRLPCLFATHGFYQRRNQPAYSHPGSYRFDFWPQSYSQVRNFAAQEKAKSAMNHMRWGLASQVTEFPLARQPARPQPGRRGVIAPLRSSHSRMVLWN